MKCVVIIMFLYAYLHVVLSQFVSSDQVIIEDVELVSYTNPLNLKDTQSSDKKTIFFKSKKFQKVPKIIVGFKAMDFDFNSISKSFEIVYDKVTTESFEMQLIKYQDTKVYRILVTYIAIDSDDAYSNQVSLSFQQWPQDNFITISKPFKIPTIDSSQIQRKVFGFIQALKSDEGKKVNRHKVEVKVDVGTSAIDITAQQDDPDKSLSEIKVNYLELYVQKNDPYYDVSIISDTKYLQSSLRQIGVYPSSAAVDYNYAADLNGVVGSLTSFDIPVTSYSGRLEISQMVINIVSPTTKQLDYQYRIWEDSQVYMFGATIGIFKMKDCSKNAATPINHSPQKQCVNACPQGYFQQKRSTSEAFSFCEINTCIIANCLLCNSSGGCIQCSPTMYLYNSMCYINQPLKTYCDQQLKCLDCKAECQSCENNTTCKSCVNGYLLNGVCTQNKPSSTYCDKDKICKPCSDPQCQNCNQFNICISCSAEKPYFFISECYQVQQQSTYCDEQKICFYCSPLCKECTGPQNNQCTSCDPSYYTLNSTKCECLEKGFGYDQKIDKCVQCQLPLCADCYGDHTKCIQCSANAVLNPQNNQCECKDPKQYYDLQYKVCKTTSIVNCKLSSKTKNECIQCNDGYFYEQLTGKCTYCSNKVYADSQNTCKLSCRPNCLICINSKDCIQEISNQNNNNNNNNKPQPQEITDCHYSCETCSSSKTATECLKCASPSTREYNQQTNLCQCRLNYKEINQPNCEEIADLDNSIGKTFQIASYISLGIQALFVFGLNSPDFQYIVILQQQLFLLTFYPDFNSDLTFYNLLKIFRHFSLFSLFENIQMFQQASYSLNLLIIFTGVMVISVVVALSFHFISFSFAQASYFRWNLVFLCSRLVSLFAFVLIFKLLFKDKLYSHTFTISVVSCFLFFYFVKTGLHLKGIYNENNHILSDGINNSSTLDNSGIRQNLHLKSALEISMEKPHQAPTPNRQNQEIEMISTFQQRQSQMNSKKKQIIIISPFQSLFSELDLQITLSKYFWLIVELRSIITGFLIGFKGDKIWAYYTLPGISFIYVMLLSFNKIQTDSKKRKLVFYIECLIICIQVFFSFYINQLSESDDQNKILILIISCCIFIIAISLIIFHLVIIFEYFKQKIDPTSDIRLQQQQQQSQPKCNMRMQSYFTKDQINAVLDQALYNSNQNHPRNKRKYF